ncbi:MAG: 5'-methylthioadenosine/adenosylhomocysteine nucleosidase [Marinilabiliales bacterium]|nr:5'-methylthioadenosine/adenosylhomocysteine nucleosidase [Marinilabiliales bacterium]
MMRDKGAKRIGIMGAMPEEIDGVVALMTETSQRIEGKRKYISGRIGDREVVVVFSRWGKVAAAITVTTLIHQFGITELWFTGVAGAIDPLLKIGDIVVATRLIQHDMDARPLLAQHEIPLLGQAYLETDASLTRLAVEVSRRLLEEQRLHELFTAHQLQAFGLEHPTCHMGDIASGDQFFSRDEQRIALQEKLPGVLCVEMEGAAVAQVCREYEIPFLVIRTISDEANDHAAIDFPAFIREISSNYSAEIIQAMLTK